MLRKAVILLLLILIYNPLRGQQTLSLLLVNAKTKEPVPFANVLFGSRQQGTMSDINGRVDLAMPMDYTFLRISCLGYQTINISLEGLTNRQSIYLEPVNIELAQVDIFPGKNPALTIMEQVYKNRDTNNPDRALDYSCIIYHKMAFYLDVPDSIQTDDQELIKMMEFNRKNHLFLIESVSEKKHLAPDKTSERLISGRVSGLEQPTLAMLPAQIQPFTFYRDYIKLLDTDFLNPISSQGLKQYRFLLNDTLLTSQGDTLFYISFEPGKQSSIRGMSGSFHIHIPSFAIKTVTAQTIQDQGPIALSIKQSYQQTRQRQWFPDQLESRLQINKTVTGQTFPFPLVGNGKSTVTGINLNPDFDKKDFTNIQFIDEAAEKNAPPVENYRYEPLTAKDLETYRLLDSLGRKHRFDRIINIQKHLVSGYIPMGYVKIDIKKLVDLNEYEGLKIGLGLWTSEKISDRFSTGGYYSRSFKSDDNNYGAGLKFNLNKLLQQEWDVYLDHALKETGDYSFLDAYGVGSPERYKKYFIETVDPVSSIQTAFRTRFLQYFKGEILFNYSEVKPVLVYPFFDDLSPIQEPFSNYEYGLKLRWAHKETFSYTQFGLTSNGTNYPLIWTNVIAGNGSMSGTSYDYHKIEAQAEKQFRPAASIKTVLRVTAASIEGTYPATRLYSAMGTHRHGTGLETPFSFATMYPNEFAASRFTALYFRNTFLTRLNKPGNFKPEITISSAFAIGDTKGAYETSPITTLNKGYYESGIYFGNLLRQLIFKYGFSIHYRYGPYQLPKEIDNWAFKFGLEIGL